jgi:hypothetical protein
MSKRFRTLVDQDVEAPSVTEAAQQEYDATHLDDSWVNVFASSADEIIKAFIQSNPLVSIPNQILNDGKVPEKIFAQTIAEKKAEDKHNFEKAAYRKHSNQPPLANLEPELKTHPGRPEYYVEDTAKMLYDNLSPEQRAQLQAEVEQDDADRLMDIGGMSSPLAIGSTRAAREFAKIGKELGKDYPKVFGSAADRLMKEYAEKRAYRDVPNVIADARKSKIYADNLTNQLLKDGTIEAHALDTRPITAVEEELLDQEARATKDYLHDKRLAKHAVGDKRYAMYDQNGVRNDLLPGELDWAANDSETMLRRKTKVLDSGRPPDTQYGQELTSSRGLRNRFEKDAELGRKIENKSNAFNMKANDAYISNEYGSDFDRAALFNDTKKSLDDFYDREGQFANKKYSDKEKNNADWIKGVMLHGEVKRPKGASIPSTPVEFVKAKDGGLRAKVPHLYLDRQAALAEHEAALRAEKAKERLWQEQLNSLVTGKQPKPAPLKEEPVDYRQIFNPDNYAPTVDHDVLRQAEINARLADEAKKPKVTPDDVNKYISSVEESNVNEINRLKTPETVDWDNDFDKAFAQGIGQKMNQDDFFDNMQPIPKKYTPKELLDEEVHKSIDPYFNPNYPEGLQNAMKHLLNPDAQLYDYHSGERNPLHKSDTEAIMTVPKEFLDDIVKKYGKDSDGWASTPEGREAQQGFWDYFKVTPEAQKRGVELYKNSIPKEPTTIDHFGDIDMLPKGNPKPSEAETLKRIMKGPNEIILDHKNPNYGPAKLTWDEYRDGWAGKYYINGVPFGNGDIYKPDDFAKTVEQMLRGKDGVVYTPNGTGVQETIKRYNLAPPPSAEEIAKAYGPVDRTNPESMLNYDQLFKKRLEEAFKKDMLTNPAPAGLDWDKGGPQYEQFKQQFEQEFGPPSEEFADKTKALINKGRAKQGKDPLAEVLKKPINNYMEDITNPLMTITRAQKEAGPTAGKMLNEYAGNIKDKSPHAEHIQNIQSIRDLKSNPALWEEFIKYHPPAAFTKPERFDSGSFKNVYVPEYGDKVIKRFNPESYIDATPYAIDEQATFNKLEDLVPNTKTYKTSENTYQVQDKITPASKYYNKTGEHMLDKSKELSEVVAQKGVEARDLAPANYGVDDSGNLKIIDVGQFSKNKELTTDEIIKLLETSRALPSDYNYFNEIFKLKKGGK